MQLAKGFIRGVLWGAGISFGAVTLISVANDGPYTGQVDAQQNSQDTASGQAETTVGSASQPVSGAFVTRTPAPEPDTLSGLSPDLVNPAAVPVTGPATSLIPSDVPATSGFDDIALLDTSAPKIGGGQTESLTTPATDPAASISTEPAQPPVPDAITPSSAFAETEVQTVDPVAAPAPEVMIEAPQIAGSDPIGVMPDTTIDADPAQPIQPSVSAQGSPFETGAETEMADSRVTAPIPSDSTSTDADVVAQAPETYPPVAPETAQIGADADDRIKPSDTIAEATDAPDAPQPVVITQIDAPDAMEFAPQEIEIAAISLEPDAPELKQSKDLDAPTGADAAQTAGESDTAAVDVTLQVDPPSETPVVAPSVAAAKIADESPAPMVKDAPAVVEQAAQDTVAVPDQAEYVASPATPVDASSAQTGEVKINRLPSLAAPLPDPSDTTEDAIVEAPNPQPVAKDLSQSPFERNAETAENPENKPVMAIVLMDTGVDLAAQNLGLPALRDFPFPISFAVDPMLPDVTERVEAYRAEGFEVLAMLDLPEGATATDADVNLSVALDRMPQAVGVLEGVTTGIQTTRESGQHVAQVLAQTGHGFVTQNQGLNTVQKLAAKEGVPSAVVFRDFDAKGQSAAVIRRFLDQAAFRAAQEGGVVMLGRLREDTVAALLVWGLQDRASKVALVPVSSALSAQN